MAPEDRSPTQRFFALIPCAGAGSRAGGLAPKQYREVGGRSLVEHTLAAFEKVSRIHLCLVVTASGEKAPAHPKSWFRVADCGGATRAASVRNGLARLRHLGMRPTDWVLVHDAVRGLVTPALIDRLIDSCQHDAVGGLLALKLADTLKVGAGDRVATTLERSDKWLAQTPQMFRAALLEEALQRAGDQVSDEAGAIEALGHAPLLVAGSSENFKITYPEDFALAEALLRSRA